jgi:lysophospholipase L1-like esterase
MSRALRREGFIVKYQEAGMAEEMTGPKSLVFLGDSLVEFFDWQSRFPDHRVYNLGIAGETVEGLLSRIRGIIQYFDSPDFIFIMAGINNVAMDDLDFVGDYIRIIDMLSSAYPGSRIYIHSLAPTLVDWMPGDSIIEVNLSLRKTAGKKGIGYIDLHRLFLDHSGDAIQDYFLPDGVHISDEGYAVWSDKIEAILNGQRP